VIESSGIGTVLLIVIFGGLLPIGLIWCAVIIVVGPRRYREWEKSRGRKPRP
jgi:hypothetical protein